MLLVGLACESAKDKPSGSPAPAPSAAVRCLALEPQFTAGLELSAAEIDTLKRACASIPELRTDPKYGKFFVHQPAQAKVDIQRANGNIIVDIKDFISPTLIERLQQQAGILTPKIEDWRAMVDCVMIDTAYDGQVFNIVLSDVPARKNNLVVGRYELTASEGETAVAVKIIDMLGEEVLVTGKV